jgi:hypothetical protein
MPWPPRGAPLHRQGRRGQSRGLPGEPAAIQSQNRDDFSRLQRKKDIDDVIAYVTARH